jgi:N6-adenosine-specific RNA methylase IME4/ParB-like chromosome segregation protein Spo0J
MAAPKLPLETPELTFHPLANVLALMEGAEYDALVADIKERGLVHPIVEFEGRILDGRNRWRACKDADAKVKIEKYKGNDPVGYVLSANLKRRNLNESQRAMAAAELANWKLGDNQYTGGSANLQTLSLPDAARLVGVSTRSAASAASVREHAIPELADKVKRGSLAVSLVEAIGKEIPREEQGQYVNADEGELRNAVKNYRRAKRERKLAEKTAKANESLETGEELYSVLYIDPPWRLEPYSRETGMDRAADNHYPTMTTDQIAALKVPAADDAVLFMWGTVPMLLEAQHVMKSWGFTYKSHCVWNKPHAGTGYWFRNKHELLLVGVKGDIPAPAPGKQFPSVIDAPLAEHSVKPEIFAEMIQTLFPSARWVELFARRPREGWAVWGNEVAEETEAAEAA